MSLHAIILTFNEEKHLERCLRSIAPTCDSLLVVDSGSTDRTEEIAREIGATFLKNSFVNYANQFNFAIDILRGRGGWLLRIDADEVLLDKPEALKSATLKTPADVDGLLVRRRVHFMGKPMKWGGMDPIWQLRIWREGRGVCEQRWMDEHIIVPGRVIKTALRIDDVNLNSLTWWTDKHNKYASREAIDVLARRYHPFSHVSVSSSTRHDQVVVKRLLKESVYLKLGSGIRALIYFIYRYVLRLGFLDGWRGWYFHVLQGFWYRTLVDAKIAEIEQYAKNAAVPLRDAIFAVTGLPLDQPEEKVVSADLLNKSS